MNEFFAKVAEKAKENKALLIKGAGTVIGAVVGGVVAGLLSSNFEDAELDGPYQEDLHASVEE